MTANIKTVRTHVTFAIVTACHLEVLEAEAVADVRWFLPTATACKAGVDPVACPRSWAAMLDALGAKHLPHFERGCTVRILAACPLVSKFD
jgi:hypothetical protein